MHPIEDIRGSKSSWLEGKRIVLGITGSIAAVECVKLARELARHGADVIPVMSGASKDIIHPESMHFATGHPPIIKLDGAVKHVELCGESSGHADLLLIAPATANTISKIATGIDDTSVTTMASCALGSGMPIVIVPAMHSSMYSHDIIIENVKRLKKLGVVFVGPVMEEKKAKMAAVENIVHEVCRSLGPDDLRKKKVLIIAGSTREAVDDVRFITNLSSGKTGIALYLEAHRRGADVTLWVGEGTDVPAHVKCKRFSGVRELNRMCTKAKADIILVPAAISDFQVKKRPGKIPSEQAVDVKLSVAPKILKTLRTNTRAKIVGFKAETGISKKELEKRAAARMKQYGINLIVANLLEDVKEDETKAIVLSPGGKRIPFTGAKTELAKLIFDTVLES